MRKHRLRLRTWPQTDADARVRVWNPSILYPEPEPLIPCSKGRVLHVLYLSSKWHFLVVWHLHLLCPLLWPLEGATFLDWIWGYLSLSPASPQPPTAWGHLCGQYINITLGNKNIWRRGWAQPAGDGRGPTPRPSDGVTGRVRAKRSDFRICSTLAQKVTSAFYKWFAIVQVIKCPQASVSSSVNWDNNNNNSSYPTLLLCKVKEGVQYLAHNKCYIYMINTILIIILSCLFLWGAIDSVSRKPALLMWHTSTATLTGPVFRKALVLPGGAQDLEAWRATLPPANSHSWFCYSTVSAPSPTQDNCLWCLVLKPASFLSTAISEFASDCPPKYYAHLIKLWRLQYRLGTRTLTEEMVCLGFDFAVCRSAHLCWGMSDPGSLSSQIGLWNRGEKRVTFKSQIRLWALTYYS